ncbi:MAG: AsmA family protein [Lautropia sp.]
MSLKFGFAASEPSANGEVSLKGDVVVDFDARSFGAKDLELNATAAIGTTRIDKARLKATRLSFDPSKSAVDVEGLDLAVSGGLEAGPFEAKVTAPRLAVSPVSAKGDSLLATISLAGGQEVKMRLEAAGIAGGTEALTIAKLAVAASTRRGERTVQADLGSPVKANLQAGTVGLTAIAGAVVINDPALPEKTTTIDLSGSASADLRKESITANLDAKAQGTALLAKVSVNGLSEPRYGVDIIADQLDLDRLFPPVQSGGAKSVGGGGKPVPGAAAPNTPNTPDTPIDLSALFALQLDGRLSVGNLRARGITATGIKASVKAAKGQLEVAPVSASLYGGRLSAQAAIKAGETPAANRLNTTVDLTGVEIGPLLKDAADQDLLEGRGNVKLVFKTGGGTVDAMKRGLDGSAAMSLRDGAIKGINLAETIRSARSLLQGGQAESRASDASKKTDFTAMSVSFVITDGVASSDDLDVRSPLLRLGGEGRVDIAASSLDYTVRASVVGTSTGQGGKELADLRGVTIPVRLTGPFDRLDWRIDWESAGKEALKSRVASELKERGVDTEQLEEKAKERAKEKIGDALKGLFKR